MQTALSYALSAATASLAMVVAFEANAETPDSFASDLIAVYLVFWGIAFALTVVCTLLPFLLTLRLAERKQITSPIFYPTCALVTALLMCAVAAWVGGLGLPSNDPDHLDFYTAFWRFLPSFLAGGTVGGLTYFFCSRRMADN